MNTPDHGFRKGETGLWALMCRSEWSVKDHGDFWRSWNLHCCSWDLLYPLALFWALCLILNVNIFSLNPFLGTYSSRSPSLPGIYCRPCSFLNLGFLCFALTVYCLKLNVLLKVLTWFPPGLIRGLPHGAGLWSLIVLTSLCCCPGCVLLWVTEVLICTIINCIWILLNWPALVRFLQEAVCKV